MSIKRIRNWEDKKLFTKLHILVKDKEGHCEFLRYAEQNRLCVSPIPEKSFKGETYSDYQREVEYAEKYFPNYKYLIVSEEYPQEINQFPYENEDFCN